MFLLLLMAACLSVKTGCSKVQAEEHTTLSLNGKPYNMRGGNIELHLYLKDPLCGSYPWDRAWVKKFNADIPKLLNWNTFRFSLSPV
jgi:hypothetical protein